MMTQARIFTRKKHIFGCVFFVFIIGCLAAQTNDSLFAYRYSQLTISEKINYHVDVSPKIEQTLKKNNILSEQLTMFETYHSFFDSILDNYGLDKDFAYIPLAISKMNVKFHSKYFHKNGLWALSYPIAVYYGLIVNDTIDERFDIQKSTIVAAKYLKHLTASFDSFAAVLFAYANSPIELKNNYKQLDLQDKDVWFWYENGNFYNREILPDMLIAAYCANFYENHHIFPKKITKNPIDTIFLSQMVACEQFNKYLHIDTSYLYALNPCLTSPYLPMNYPILIPTNKIADFYLWEDSLYVYKNDVCANKDVQTAENIEERRVGENKYHIVKNGDVLGKLAVKYHISVDMIKKWNKLTNDVIYVGQKLIVGKENNGATLSEKIGQVPNTQQSTDKKTIVYVVRKGDTLGYIAKKHHISVSALMKQNKLSTDKIFIGQRLTIEK